jgi:hypothetical protein
VGLDPFPLPRQGSAVAELDRTRTAAPGRDTGQPAGPAGPAQPARHARHGAYHVLMWAVVRLGGAGELATRLPSALAMAAAGVVAMLVAVSQHLYARNP